MQESVYLLHLITWQGRIMPPLVELLLELFPKKFDNGHFLSAL